MALMRNTASLVTDWDKLLVQDTDSTVAFDTHTTALTTETPTVEKVQFSGSDQLAAGVTQTGVFGADDFLVGGDGNDWLYGLSGDDMLFGNDGGDTLHGGAGADTLFGGDGIDTASYVYSPEWVYVNLAAHLGSGGDAEGDQIWEIENVIGSDGGDQIWGDDAANFLDGRKDSDFLQGVAGDDYLRGGDGDDHLEGGDDDDTLEGDADADTLLGGEGDDVLEGGSGTDTLYGDGGNDWIDGGSGDDHIDGGLGDDRIDGGAGVDLMAGGDGADTFVHYAWMPEIGDVITDFDPLEDILELHGIANATDSDVQLIMNGQGDAQLNFSGGGSLTLQGVEVAASDTLADLAQQVTIDYVA